MMWIDLTSRGVGVGLQQSGGRLTMKGVAASLADHVSTSSTLYLCEPACRLSIGVLHMKGCGIIRLILAGKVTKHMDACATRASNCILSTPNRLVVFCCSRQGSASSGSVWRLSEV